MKNLLKLALVATLAAGAAYGDDDQTASEAVKRFEGVKNVFAQKGMGAIAFLNGINTPASGGSKGSNTTASLEVGIDNFNDPNAPLICIGSDDTYIVHTSQTNLIGKSATSGDSIWQDGGKTTIVESARKALAQGTNKGLESIKYAQNTALADPEGKPLVENFLLAIADDRFIPGLPKGAFCATRIKSFAP